MATTRIVWCLVINHENKPLGNVFNVRIPSTDSVDDLKDAVKKKKEPDLNHLAANQLCVWKPTKTISAAEDLQTVIQLVDGENAQLLNPTTELASLDLEKLELLLVTMSLPLGYKRRGSGAEGSSAKRFKFSRDQEEDVKIARTALAASSAAAMPAFQKEQQKRPVLNGRPCHNFGPPIGLFHLIFDSFQAAKDDESILIDAQTYASVRKLFEASAQIYNGEDKRIDALDKHLPMLLDTDFVGVSASGVHSDGVIVHSTGPYNAYLVVRKVKNEIGTGSADPYNQGSLLYRKYWVEAKQDSLRAISYCPSFILAIAGPWLCVLGAVYVDRAIVQPLTDYLWLGGDVFSDDRLRSVSRLFAAVRTSISKLREYYDSLSNGAGDRPDGFPFVRDFQGQAFIYIERLEEDRADQLIYKVKTKDRSGRFLVVKFVPTYNAAAHRLLADRQLAPALHYAGTEHNNEKTYGGRYMIVMDFVVGTPLTRSLSEEQFGQVKEALGILHSADLVFGDLRSPNILITAEEKVMIIDFDWCKKAGEGRYPVTLNEEGIDWPEGVHPGSIMEKQHDLDMLCRLR